MGNSQSSSMKSIYKTLTDVTNDVFNSQEQTAQTITKSGNDFQVNVVNARNCNISNNQVVSGVQTIKARADFSSSTNLSTIVDTFIQSSKTNNQDATAGFLQTAINSQASSISTQTDLETVIKNSVTNQQAQTCQSILDSLNSGKINVENCLDSQITNVQSIYAQQTVDCTAKFIADTLLKNADIKKVYDIMESSQKAKGGLTFGSIIAILVIVVVVILAIVFVPKLLKGSASSQAQESMMGGMGGGGYSRGYGRGRY